MKVYIKGNYLVIEHKGEKYYGLRKEVFIDKSNVDKSTYKIFNIKNWKNSNILHIGSIQKEDNTFYTEEEFDTFYQENTGNFKSGSEIDPQILEALNGANSPSTSNPFATTTDLGVKDINTGLYQLKADTLEVSQTSSNPMSTGKIKWNTADGTFDMGMLNDVVLQVGQETYFYGKASENITNGDVVQFAGSQGDHILVKKAVPSEINTNPEYLIGVATQDLNANDYGYVTCFGKVRGLNTTIYTNPVLYFDSGNTLSGKLTDVKPTYPNVAISVAAKIRNHSQQGIIIVRPDIVRPTSIERFVTDGYEFFTDFQGYGGNNNFLHGELFTITAVGTGNAFIGAFGTFKDALLVSTTGSNSIQNLQGGNSRYNGCIFKFTTLHEPANLSNSTDKYRLLIGLTDTQSTTNTNAGIFFYYDKYGDGNILTASNNYLCVCKNGNNISIVDSGVPVAVGVAKKLHFTKNRNDSEVKFYIDNTLVATITTNIPIGAMRKYICQQKYLGTTEVLNYYDYIYYTTTGKNRI